MKDRTQDIDLTKCSSATAMKLAKALAWHLSIVTGMAASYAVVVSSGVVRKLPDQIEAILLKIFGV
ncbi:MAG: hypothetical protein R3D68_19565 [Hyphomicrobiaceae bacterium]